MPINKQSTEASFTLPGWLTVGNLVAIVTALASVVGVWAGTVSNNAVQDDKIKRLEEEQRMLRREIRDDVREVRKSLEVIQGELMRQNNGRGSR